MFDDIKDPQDTLVVEVKIGGEKNAIVPLLPSLGTGLPFADFKILDYAGHELDTTDRVEVVGTITSSTSAQDITEERLVMGPDGNPVAQPVVVATAMVTDCKLSVEEIYPAP